MKPLTLFLALASVLVALAIAVLLVLTSRELDARPYNWIEIAWMSVPIVLILLGAYRLSTGCHVARIGLGLVYTLMAATFLFFSGYEVIGRSRSIYAVALPLVWGTVLGSGSLLLFLSSTLKAEMRDIRMSRRKDSSRTQGRQAQRR